MTTVTLPIPPSANRYWRRYGRQIVVSDEARRYRGLVAELVRRVLAVPLAGPVSVEVDVYPANAGRDLDNNAKTLLDALQGSAYVNDKQVSRLTLQKHPKDGDPRVEVRVKPASVEAGTGRTSLRGT